MELVRHHFLSLLAQPRRQWSKLYEWIICIQKRYVKLGMALLWLLADEINVSDQSGRTSWYIQRVINYCLWCTECSLKSLQSNFLILDRTHRVIHKIWRSINDAKDATVRQSRSRRNINKRLSPKKDPFFPLSFWKLYDISFYLSIYIHGTAHTDLIQQELLFFFFFWFVFRLSLKNDQFIVSQMHLNENRVLLKLPSWSNSCSGL